MEIGDRIEHMRDKVRQHRIEGKLEHLQQENVRLEREARMLHGALRDERAGLATGLKALERTSRARAPRHRLRQLLMLAGVAVGAYTLGAKAGRERYEDIRSTWRKTVRNGRSAVEDVRYRTADAIDDAQVVSSRLSDAGQVVGETLKAIAEGPANGSIERDRSAPTRSV